MNESLRVLGAKLKISRGPVGRKQGFCFKNKIAAFGHFLRHIAEIMIFYSYAHLETSTFQKEQLPTCNQTFSKQNTKSSLLHIVGSATSGQQSVWPWTSIENSWGWNHFSKILAISILTSKDQCLNKETVLRKNRNLPIKVPLLHTTRFCHNRRILYILPSNLLTTSRHIIWLLQHSFRPKFIDGNHTSQSHVHQAKGIGEGV